MKKEIRHFLYAKFKRRNYIYICVCVCVRVCVCVCVYIYIYIYIVVYLCLYIYIFWFWGEIWHQHFFVRFTTTWYSYILNVINRSASLTNFSFDTLKQLVKHLWPGDVLFRWNRSPDLHNKPLSLSLISIRTQWAALTWEVELFSG